MIYRYVIPEIPPSNNKFIGRNARWQYQAEKKRWADLIALLCKPRPQEPIPYARRHDPDNYAGKMILDGLVRSDIIQDDSFDCINLSLVGRYDKLNPRTEIVIEELGIFKTKVVHEIQDNGR